jgi:starch phosphorylase
VDHPQGRRRAPDTYGRALYEKLEGTVLPLLHRDPVGWTRMMKAAISKVGAVFTSHRMMGRYAAEAYLSCAG